MKRVYIVADGSTGDTISPVSVVREIKKRQSIEVYGVFDQAAKTMLMHMGFEDEIKAGQIRFANIDYSDLLQSVDLAGRIKGMFSFLQIVRTLLSASIPHMLDTWMELLEELHYHENLNPYNSIIVGNDLGATWLVQPISLYLEPVVRDSFVSMNAHPWSPGPHEFEYHFSPHFIRPSFLSPKMVNGWFRSIVRMQYASIGEKYAQDYARKHQLDPATIVHFDAIIDTLHRHYSFERITLSHEEQARQKVQPTVSLGGYPLDLRIDLIHRETQEALNRANAQGKKVVTIALGSMTGTPENQNKVISRIIKACSQRSDVLTILIGGYAHDVLETHDDLVKVEYENYIPLFAQSNLVFISGAAGTFHHALATGTPCICVPILPDQITNAQWSVQEQFSPGYMGYLRLLNGGVSADTALKEKIDAALDQQSFPKRGADLAAQVEHQGLDIATDYAISYLTEIAQQTSQSALDAYNAPTLG